MIWSKVVLTSCQKNMMEENDKCVEWAFSEFSDLKKKKKKKKIWDFSWYQMKLVFSHNPCKILQLKYVFFWMILVKMCVNLVIMIKLI